MKWSAVLIAMAGLAGVAQPTPAEAQWSVVSFDPVFAPAVPCYSSPFVPSYVTSVRSYYSVSRPIVTSPVIVAPTVSAVPCYMPGSPILWTIP